MDLLAVDADAPKEVKSLVDNILSAVKRRKDKNESTKLQNTKPSILSKKIVPPPLPKKLPPPLPGQGPTEP